MKEYFIKFRDIQPNGVIVERIKTTIVKAESAIEAVKKLEKDRAEFVIEDIKRI